MRATVRALAVAGVLLLTSGTAAAQIAPGELGETGFFGESALSPLQSLLPNLSPPNDKNNPVTVTVPKGTLYGFFHKSDPILLFAGEGPFELGADVLLPSDLFALKGFVWIYSRKDATLSLDDFPEALRTPLQGFWPSGQIKLFAKTIAMRTEPTGDLLDDLRGFLRLDRVDGRTVVSFTKGNGRAITALMLFGTIAQPFGMDMTLTNPEIGYSKQAGKPCPTVSLASDVSIYGHSYEFKAEGADPKKPDIFLLKTSSLNPQDLVNIQRAFSKPLFDLAMGTNPGWKFDLIPTFSLHPPRAQNPNFPTVDQNKVVVFAAMPGADRPDWKIKGPAIEIRGSLQVHLMPKKQDIALVEVAMDKSSLNATFGLPSFSLPNSDLTFGTATASLGATAGTAHLGIAAESGSPCLKQKFNFSVDQSGVPKFNVNANQTLKAMTPEGFMGSFKTCATEGAKLAQWTLKAGEQLLGFGRDQMMRAATPVFGARNVAAAAKVLGYPRDLVASSLAAVVPNAQDVLRIGRDIYGVEQLGGFGKAAGYSIETIFSWHRSASRMGPMPSLNFKEVADIDRFMDWGREYGQGLTEAGKFAGTLFPKDDMLKAGQKVFDEIGLGGVAFLGRTAGYNATDLTHYFNAQGVAKSGIAKVLQGGGFAKDQAVGAITTVYGGTRGEAEKLWDGIAEPAGDAVKKGCHTVLGWAKIC